MGVERKQFSEKLEKKKLEKVNTKKVKRGFNPESLNDAFVDGKFVGQINSEIIVSRFRNGKNTFSVCTVKQLDDSGLIHTFDETLQQWFSFSATDSPKIVKLVN
jgi:hypothetical protein